MKRINLPLILLLLFAVFLTAQEDTGVRLSNGLKIADLQGGDARIASLVLVCPLEGSYSAGEKAAAALLNEVIWMNTAREDSDGAQAYNELVQAARRFEGTLSSELAPDGLLIQMSLPESLLAFMLERYAGFWSDFQLDQKTLEAAKTRLIAKERAVSLASAESQIAGRLMPHVWPQHHYGMSYHGSEAAVQSLTLEQVRQVFQRLKQPADWTLLVRGPEIDTNTLQLMEDTLGTLQPGGEVAAGVAAQPVPLDTRKKIVLESGTEEHYAAVAYRLATGGSEATVMVDLLQQMLIKSPAMSELVNQLQSGDAQAVLTLNGESRRYGSMFYFVANWSGQTLSVNSVVELITGFMANYPQNDEFEADFETARKRLMLEYWIRFAKIDEYTLWRARQLVTGYADDQYIEMLEGITSNDVRDFITETFNLNSSVSLITVAP